MDLFVVQRYKGENANNITDEERNLKKVLKKIEKSKLAREKRNFSGSVEVKNKDVSATNKNEKEEQIEGTEVTANKDNEETAISINNVIEEESDEDEQPKAKKSKFDVSEIKGFTILGVDKFEGKKSVKRILPNWLRNPTIISSDLNNLSTKVSKIKLNSSLKRKLKEKNIKYLFPVQETFISWQLQAVKCSDLIAIPDVCVSAPTGSGKTFAFLLPVLQHLMEQLENGLLAVKAVRALIVLPTQNLALQIFSAVNFLTTNSDIHVGLATGSGTDTLENEQKNLIQYNSVWGAISKVDILVCTPGRLVDHLKGTKDFNLKHLQYVIIDEADRILDYIQNDWLYHLESHLQTENTNLTNRNILNLVTLKKRTDPQKLLFSATLSQDPEKLQKLSLFQPKLFTCITDNNKVTTSERFIGKYTTPNELIEQYIICAISTKPLVLYKLIMNEINKSNTSRILVFVNTIEAVHRLKFLLNIMAENKFNVAEISSRGNLEVRNSVLKKFEHNKLRVLVCTDSMARGIDIPNVDCVISYDLPFHIKTYIHRAGRTARAGCQGLCISMLGSKQQTSFMNLIESMRSETNSFKKIEIPTAEIEELSPFYKKSLDKLKNKITYEQQQFALNIKNKKLLYNEKNARKKRKRKVSKKHDVAKESLAQVKEPDQQQSALNNKE